jgi:hypothetical protein
VYKHMRCEVIFALALPTQRWYYLETLRSC